MSRLFDGLRALASADDVGIVLDLDESEPRSRRVSTDLTDVIARAMSSNGLVVLIGDPRCGLEHPGDRILDVLSPPRSDGASASTVHDLLEWQQVDRGSRCLLIHNGTITIGSGTTSCRPLTDPGRSVLFATDRPLSPHRSSSLGPCGMEVSVGFRDSVTDVHVGDVVELVGVLDALLTFRAMGRRLDAGSALSANSARSAR